MIELVDTHCHIQSIGLDTGERSTRELWAKADNLTAEKVVSEAVSEGVSRMICVGCDLEDSQLAVDFVQNRENCWASIGIHPHDAQHFIHGESSNLLAQFAALAHQPKVVAVGECGLDYFYENSPRDKQVKALEYQLDLALEAGLPVIFHVREAFSDFWPIFDAFKGVRGVLHSYTDSVVNLEKALDRGLHIGVNGIATFAKDDNLLGVYKAVPDDRLLLETDAPFLTPKPFRGKINEPKQIGTIAEFMAQLRETEISSLATATSANARRLFGI